MQNGRLVELYNNSLKKNRSRDLEIIRMEEQHKWEKSLQATNKISYDLPIQRNRSMSFDDSKKGHTPRPVVIQPQKSVKIFRTKFSNTVPTAHLTKMVQELRLKKIHDPALSSMNNLPKPTTIQDNVDIQLYRPISATVSALDRLI